MRYRNENVNVPIVTSGSTFEYLYANGSLDYQSYIDTSVNILGNDVEVEIKFRPELPESLSCCLAAAEWYKEGHLI